MNENYAQPSLPAGSEEGDRARHVPAVDAAKAHAGRVRLLGRGTILREVIAAAELLARDWNVASDGVQRDELQRARARRARGRRAGIACTRRSRRGAAMSRNCSPGSTPIVAATDYVRAYPQLIAAHVDARFVALGTDGFGRSDTRAALRQFFEVDRHHIVVAALHVLTDDARAAEAIDRYGIDADAPSPWGR